MKKSVVFDLVFTLTIILILFVISSFLTANYSETIKTKIGNNPVSMALYVLLIIIDVVFAPVSIIPLIPIATSTWGWFIAGLLTLIGSTIGSVVVFIITRNYGVPIIAKLTSIEKVWAIQKAIPEKNIFLGVVLIRIFIPLDVMSYAISLFTKMSLKKYTLATFIGYISTSFLLAYLGGFDAETLILLISIGVLVLGIFSSIVLSSVKIRKKLGDELKKVFRD